MFRAHGLTMRRRDDQIRPHIPLKLRLPASTHLVGVYVLTSTSGTAPITHKNPAHPYRCE
jgi:hypothetical protein